MKRWWCNEYIGSLSNNNFFWSWILKHSIKVQETKTKVVVLCLRPPQNVKLGIFTSQSCCDGKAMYKKAWCKCRVVVLLIETYFFFAILVDVAVVVAFEQSTRWPQLKAHLQSKIQRKTKELLHRLQSWYNLSNIVDGQASLHRLSRYL